MITKTTLTVTFILYAALLIMSACSSENNDNEADPCAQLSCQHGGEKIADAEMGTCRCKCPDGYAGDNCEKEVQECPVTVECPAGKTPNPENDCRCE